QRRLRTPTAVSLRCRKNTGLVASDPTGCSGAVGMDPAARIAPQNFRTHCPSKRPKNGYRGEPRPCAVALLGTFVYIVPCKKCHIFVIKVAFKTCQSMPTIMYT